jgi:O-antigen ligase
VGAFNALPPVVAERLEAITSNLRIFDAGKVSVNDANFAVVERMAHWQVAWRMWQSEPFFGIGPGNFNEAYPSFFLGRWAISQGHAHNYYLHILAEAGIAGLVFYLLLIVAVFVEAFQLHRTQRGTVWGAMGLGGCGIILAVAGHNIFENLHVLNLGIQLSGVWGLMIVARRLAVR